MSSYPATRSLEYVRSYRTMLHDFNLSKYQRVLPRIPSKGRVYKPTSTVSTTDASPVFIPLFYAGEKGALGVWDKYVGTGFAKRRLDEEDRSYHVLELSNPRNNLGTFICAPKSALQALHITLPNMTLVMKNYRRNFGFEVLIMDSNAYRRRFSFATWHNPALLRKFSFMCQIPLRLEIGWNEIHVNFNELVKTTYKTSYVETIRVQIYANCKLRQVFFCDDKIMKGEVPVPSMRDFTNIRMIPLDYGPRTHPDGIEPGPDKRRNVPYIDPPSQLSPSRLEQDLKVLQRRRFNEVSRQRLALQPYKTYFRELLQEEKQKKKISNVVQAALKEEMANQASKTDDDKKVAADSTNNNKDTASTSSAAAVTPAPATPSSSSKAPTEKVPAAAVTPVPTTPTTSKVPTEKVTAATPLTASKNNDIHVVTIPTPKPNEQQ